jgi:dihydrodipicolinate synthase/N-acetylneuraminate lyase
MIDCEPFDLLRPRRRITGISAILLPFCDDGSVDWDGLSAHVARTAEAGLTPAVNMDTGFANLLDGATREAVLMHTRTTLAGGAFVAGAYVRDLPGSNWDEAGYLRETDIIQQYGGTPIVFQSYGLTTRTNAGILAAYSRIAAACDRFIGFELGTMFAPFGKIYDLEVYEGLVGIPQCIGAKHSSLIREREWERLRLRDRLRPDFKVFTGNDLAVDMVMYGSDYLLGLSTFAPDLFARRDAYWEQGDSAFFRLNDVLQYLGCFAFRNPVPAYKHSAAQFLKLRGWITSDRTHPQSPQRPESDVAVLHDILERLLS